MSRSIHVLITSLSKKVPLIKAARNALQYFDKNSSIIGADQDANCIGKYFVDGFWHMPPIDTLTKERILDYCKKKNMNAVIPTRDKELEIWSAYQSYFLDHGIHVMVSPLGGIKSCLDKKMFYDQLQSHQISTPKTSQNIDEIHAKTFVVKEIQGSGSKGIGLKLSYEEAKHFAKTSIQPIFQAFIEGEEYSVDLYIDQENSVKGVIARKRLLVIDGESQITETTRAEKLEQLCKKTALLLGLKGHIIFQVILDKVTGQYEIIECNPRFGGASTLSVAAGLDSFRWFFHETLNEALPEFKRTETEIKLIRHAEDFFIRL